MKNFSQGAENQGTSSSKIPGSIPAGPDENIVHVDELLKDLIPDFMTRRFQEIEQLDQLIASQDFKAIAQFGHKLKGSSLNYGFERLGGLARQLESAAQSEQLSEIKELAQKIREHVQSVQIVYVEET